MASLLHLFVALQHKTDGCHYPEAILWIDKLNVVLQVIVKHEVEEFGAEGISHELPSACVVKLFNYTKRRPFIIIFR